MDDLPRRNRLDRNTPAEIAIRDAVHLVEAAGCAPELTAVVVKLQEARDLLADYVDTHPPTFPTGGHVDQSTVKLCLGGCCR